MTQSYRQGVCRVQSLNFNFCAKRLFHHQLDLLLRGRSIAANGDFGLAWSVFVDEHPELGGGNDCSSLGSAELEDYLGIFVQKGRFNRKVIGRVVRAEFAYELVYFLKFEIGVALLAQVQHPGIHKLRMFLFIYTDDPETKNIGSGINS